MDKFALDNRSRMEKVDHETFYERTLKRAKAFGCYQVRSGSYSDHPENQQLKLSMGIAMEPMKREEPCLAFVMPL